MLSLFVFLGIIGYHSQINLQGKSHSDSQEELNEADDDAEVSFTVANNKEDKDVASTDVAMEIDSHSTRDSDEKSSKLSSTERERRILRKNEGGEFEIASQTSTKAEEGTANIVSEETINVVSSSNPSDVDAEVEKNTENKNTKENNESDEDEDAEKPKTPASPVVTRRSRRQVKRKEAEKEVKVESVEDPSNDALDNDSIGPFTGFGARREYLDLEENMDDSASANDRFEVDSVDGSELEDIDSVDSGSTITRRGTIGTAKNKGKKPNRKASGRKGSAKGGKGNKNKGALGTNSKGKGRRGIFKKSVSRNNVKT